jgi:hypothetical protein
VSNYTLEIIPRVALQPGILDLLAAERRHSPQVIACFLILKSGNSDFSEVDNEVILDHFVILDVSLCLRDVLKDTLSL